MRKMLPLAAALAIAAATPALSQSVSGQVTKVDPSAGKMTIKHGPIKDLDMDAMTMVFRVQDPAMLRMVKPGDRIRFDAERVNGAITVTRIQKAK